MSLLSNIGGMLPAAYQGYNKGVDDEVARQERTKDIADKDLSRKNAQELAPLQQEARKSQLQGAIAEGKAQDELRPGKLQIEKQKQQGTLDLLPGQLKLEKNAQSMNLDQILYDKVDQLRKGAKTVQDTQDYFNASAGEALRNNDMQTLNRIFNHMIDAPGVFPGLDGSPKPTKVDIVNAPAGSLDFTGQPVEGRALQLTMPDGSTKLATTRFIDAAYAKKLGADQQASIKILKPGETAFDQRTGKELFGTDPTPPRGWIRDENGDLQYLGTGGAGGAGGSATSSKKAPATPGSAATGAFETLATKSEAKLTTAQFAEGQELAQRLGAQAESPEQAARIAHDVVTNPASVTPSINATTGEISGVYRNPSVARGRSFEIAPAYKTPEEVQAAFPKDKVAMKNMVTEMLSKQGSDLPPDTAKQVQAAMTQAARDPAARKEMVAYVMDKKGPEAAAIMERKLDLIGKYLPMEQAPKRGAPFSVGGMFGGDQSWNKTDPASPAGKVQARNAEARQAGAAKQTDAKAQQLADQQKLGTQFQADKAALTPLQLSQKYDGVRGQLAPADASELQVIERKI